METIAKVTINSGDVQDSDPTYEAWKPWCDKDKSNN